MPATRAEPKGHFSPVHQIRIGGDDVTDNNAALDIVTKSLASYAERAYAVNTNEEEVRRSKGRYRGALPTLLHHSRLAYISRL